MAISFQNNCFKLDTRNTSYLMKVIDLNYLMHQYYGAYIQDYDISNLLPLIERAFSPNPAEKSYIGREFSLDSIMQEYSGNGTGDYRLSSIAVDSKEGFSTVDLKYASHTISDGKPELKGLPGTIDPQNEAQTLSIKLIDDVANIEVILNYTVFEASDFITRSVQVTNLGQAAVKLQKVMSLCLDFPSNDFDMIQLHGGWANERQAERTPVRYGTQGFFSKRGTSSHQHNPFFALCHRDTTEFCGDAYGFGLVYSGNHLTEVEKNQFDTLRCTMGINPDFFSWTLEKGDSFTSPEAVLVYSNNGLNGMSQCFHNLIRNNICRGQWAHKRRPILVNNWEATYFDFSESKLLDIAKSASALGIEMMVLDDGWFGKRNTDTTSLGDWFTNKEKLPNGLSSLASKINELGMDFGLWFEPEMLSEESELCKSHPDWFLSQPGRKPSTGRDQLILDFSREDVRNNIWEQIDAILKEANITYIKWDMNRNITEAGSALLPSDRQGEVYHRYVLGVYDLLNRLCTKYPHILLEGCSGGGGRFDMGMLCYAPQIWTSDDSDAIERVKIQYGTSYCYPLSSMAAHVSAVPNHQTRRITPFKTRGDIAAWGTFGYELDLTTLSDEEKEQVRTQCEFIKTYGEALHNGTFYRLISPYKSNRAAWAVISEDKKDIFALYITIQGEANGPQQLLPLPFVDPDSVYMDADTKQHFFGSTLQHVGLSIPFQFGDYVTTRFHLSLVE